MKKEEADKTRASDTTSETSQKAKKSRESGKADSTTFPTLSTKTSDHLKFEQDVAPNCGCSTKREAFFDKLLNYLEKQSEVISRCCLDSEQNKRLNTNSVAPKNESAVPNKSESASEKSKPLSEDRVSKSEKTKDKECKIVVEVCTCNKRGFNSAVSNKSGKSSSRNEPENFQNKQSSKISKTTNEVDCSGCEKKVETFFKLAEEICQAYMKRCLMNDDLKDISPLQSEQIVTIEELNEPRRTNMRERENNKDERGCNSLTVEVECNGDREEYVIEPCDCVRKSSRPPSNFPSRTNQEETYGNQCPPKSCIQLFEERYGCILRELHSKLTKQNPQAGQGYSNPPAGQGYSNPPRGSQAPPRGSQAPPPGVQQQYPLSQQPTYPPPQKKQSRAPSQRPRSMAEPEQYPPPADPYEQPQNQPPYQQPQPYPQYQQPQPYPQYQQPEPQYQQRQSKYQPQGPFQPYGTMSPEPGQLEDPEGRDRPKPPKKDKKKKR